jgi:folate-binding protein YgfZ
MGADATLPRSPLHEVHAAMSAAFGEVDGWEMPRVYENIKREYLAAKGTVAIMDRSHHGRLRVSGEKRFDLLNRLTSNDLTAIAPGQGARTAMLTDKGRIIDDLRLYARDDYYYLLTSPGNAETVKTQIESRRFRDDVAVDDVTASTVMISLYGPQSAHLLEGICRARKLGELPAHHGAEIVAGGASFVAARTAEVGTIGFNLIAAADHAGGLWRALLEGGPTYGISPLGEEAYEMVRIECGVPRFGRELTGEVNPLEAGLTDAVSFKKGCYVGQEVVARLDSRQKISKHLVGLWLAPGPVPEAGSAIVLPGEGESGAGRLTSVAPSLDFRRVIGLGYVRTQSADPGTPLEVIDADGDRIAAEVSALPFPPPPEPA